jgi:hypothetical protein
MFNIRGFMFIHQTLPISERGLMRVKKEENGSFQARPLSKANLLLGQMNHHKTATK